MKRFMALYSSQFNNINENVVKGIREKDDMSKSIEECCREIERALPEFIKYRGMTWDDSGRTMRDVNKTKSKDKKDPTMSISVNRTYSRLAIYRFNIKYDGESRLVEMPIHIPLLFDGYHYLIRGNKYSAPYQIIEGVTFTNKEDMVVLKTMQRPIKMSREKCVITDLHGAKYNTHQMFLALNVKKVPFLLFYFAHFGFAATHKFFGCDKFLKFFDEYPIEPDPKRIFFKFGTFFISVDREVFEVNYLLRQYVATMMAMGRRGVNPDTAKRVTYWVTLLGASISDSKTIEKGYALLSTFMVALDHKTMQTIEQLVGGAPKITMYSVVRWMFIKYATLSAKSNSLDNKRIRFAEYQINPLVRALYAKLYRFMNTGLRMKDIRRLADIFKISPAIITNAIIGKSRGKSGGLTIAKYSSYVNDLALLNVALKFTIAGPGSPMEKSGKLVGPSYRRFEPSSVGRTCLITTSNSDPGISGSLVPWADIDMETLTFKSLEPPVPKTFTVIPAKKTSELPTIKAV